MQTVTPKEKLVLDLIAQGLSTKEMADKLNISFHTVESHRKMLRLKFEARNSVELIMKASQRMLADDLQSSTETK
jgi:DNA-binding CsgD family transcriptional regulator